MIHFHGNPNCNTRSGRCISSAAKDLEEYSRLYIADPWRYCSKCLTSAPNRTASKRYTKLRQSVEQWKSLETSLPGMPFPHHRIETPLNGRIYHFSREQLEACTLRTGQRANPDSFVLVTEDPPRFVRGDDYNAAMDAGPRILAFIKEQFDLGVEVNQSDVWSDGIPIEYFGMVKASEQQRIQDGILACGAKRAVVRAGHAPGALDIEYTLPDGQTICGWDGNKL